LRSSQRPAIRTLRAFAPEVVLLKLRFGPDALLRSPPIGRRDSGADDPGTIGLNHARFGITEDQRPAGRNLDRRLDHLARDERRTPGLSEADRKVDAFRYEIADIRVFTETCQK
jgi:hypothetical protein